MHGAALGAKETEATREKLQWKYGEFEIPEQAYKLFGRAKEAGSKAEQAWEQSLADYGKKYPEVSPLALSASLPAFTLTGSGTSNIHLPSSWRAHL